MRRFVVFIVAWCVGTFAVLAPSAAFAASAVPGSTGGKIVPGSFISLKTLMPSLTTPFTSGGVATGGVTVTEALGVAVGGAGQTATANMTAARAIPWATVGKIGAKALAAGSVYGTVGLAIYALVRCRNMTAAANLYAGGLECDAGTAPTPGGSVTGYRCQNSSSYAADQCPLMATKIEAATRGVAMNCGSSTRPTRDVVNPIPWDASNPLGYYGQCQSTNGSWFGYSGTLGTGSITTEASCSGGAAIGIDGKCPTGNWEPKSAQEVADIANQFQQMKDQAKAILDNAVQNVPGAAEDLDEETKTLPTTVTGPASITAPAKTTTTQVGSGTPTVKTETPTHNITYSGDTYSYTTTVVTVEGDTTTTTNEQPKIEVCGLPNTPPCKIDETGTDTGATAANDATTKINAAKDAAVAQVEGIVQPTGLGWAFSLPLPEGACSAFSITTNRFGTHEFFTVCGNSNVELMRQLWAWAVGIMAAGYIWWRVNETIQGQ
jgi:hypothetical protein